MAGADPDKRRTPRIQPFVVLCNLVAKDRRLSGYLTDLSPLGCRVACDSELPEVGTRLGLETRLGRSRVPCHLEGTVTWTEPTPRGKTAGVCGLTFEKLGARERRILESVVEEFRRLADQLA